MNGLTRRLVTTFGPALTIVLAQLVFFPLSSGLFLRGVIIGTLTALVALGMALVYRANRIINFAQADLGFAPAVVTFLLLTESGLPWLAAVAIGLGSALALGAGAERLVIRRFFRAPRLLVTIATIGMSQILVGAALLIPALWGLGLTDMVGVGDRMPAPFDHVVRIGGVNFDANSLLALAVAPACVALIGLFLRRSNLGIAVRASADNADRASLLGIPVFRVQSVVWMLAAGLGFTAVFLRSGILGLPVFGSALAFPVLLRALVAFLVGRMTNLVGVTATAVALGALEVGVTQNHDNDITLTQPVLAGIVVIALVLYRRSVAERGSSEESAWRGAEEVRPVPPRLARLPLVRLTRAAFVLAAGLFALALPQFLGVGDLLKATTLLVYALLGLSLVLLAGWGGRVSLGQVGYFAAGAASAAWMVLHWEVDLVVALAAAGVVGAVLAVLVGIPTLRLPGLYLAVTTFAFGLVTVSYLLNPKYFDWVPEERVPRAPLLGGWDAAGSDEATYYLVLAVLVLTMVGLRNVRSSRFGRALVALRDNDRAAQAYGIDGTKVQLTASALSGAVAGLAGALFMHSENFFHPASSHYSPLENIAVLTMVVVGGLSSALGPLLGALFLLGTRWFLPSDWQLLVAGAGVLVVLLAAPGGLASVIYRLRDRWLRHLAQRLSLDVPAYSASLTETQALPDSAPGAADVEKSAATVEKSTTTELQEAGGEVSPALLEVRGLEVRYGDVPVLADVDLEVQPGESVALLGTNGAGKSTLLRSVSGLVKPAGGWIAFDGEDIAGRPAHQITGRGLVQMPGGHGVFESLTVEENLRAAAWLHRREQATVREGRQRVADLFPVLAARKDDLAGNLSGGQQQMLALALAVIGRPRLLMIDELSLGLAPSVVGELLSMVDSLRDEGVSLVVVEQSVNVALELADRAVFLERGRVRFSGPAAELLDRPDLLRSVFLGAASPPTGAVGHRTDRSGRADIDKKPMSARPEGVPALEVVELSVSFGGVKAVDRASFEVAEREIVGVIGPNGAGKTTLFDLLSGIVPAESGQVMLHGRDIGGLRASQRARKGLGRSFQDARLFPSLTVEETIAAALERWVPAGDALTNALQLPNAVDSEHAVRTRVAELIELLGLGSHRSLFVGELSTGTRRVVDLACLLAHRPRVVLLDEPASGIAQREVEALAPLIERIRDELDASVVLVEHDIPLVQQVADRIVAMDQGRVLAMGFPQEVLDHPEVVASYLGQDGRAVQRSGEGRWSPEQMSEEMSSVEQ